MMCLASDRIAPFTSDFPTRSDPARSTRWHLETNLAPLSLFYPSIATVKIQCDLEELRFIGVLLTYKKW